MQAVNVLNVAACLLVGLLVLRTGTAALSHWFPNSSAAAAAHFLVG